MCPGLLAAPISPTQFSVCILGKKSFTTATEGFIRVELNISHCEEVWEGIILLQSCWSSTRSAVGVCCSSCSYGCPTCFSGKSDDRVFHHFVYLIRFKAVDSKVSTELGFLECSVLCALIFNHTYDALCKRIVSEGFVRRSLKWQSPAPYLWQGTALLARWWCPVSFWLFQITHSRPLSLAKVYHS